MLTIHDRKIERAVIVDDEEGARDAYEYVIEDMALQPRQVTGPLDDMSKFVSSIESDEVVLCDYHLKKHSYAKWDGDRLMAGCFQADVPGVLCTAIADAPIRRDFLRYIPGLLRTSTPEPTDLRQAWERCVRELDGQFESTRRPWRTLVRVVDVDPNHGCFYAAVPAWDAHRKVRIDNDNLPAEILELVGPDRRFHAVVNTGATNHLDLFFDEWEPQ